MRPVFHKKTTFPVIFTHFIGKNRFISLTMLVKLYRTFLGNAIDRIACFIVKVAVK